MNQQPEPILPKKMAVAVHETFAPFPWQRTPLTSLMCFTCHVCSGGDARWVICSECNGSRRVPTLAWEIKRTPDLRRG